jgi:hypothetical protein
LEGSICDSNTTVFYDLNRLLEKGKIRNLIKQKTADSTCHYSFDLLPKSRIKIDLNRYVYHISTRIPQANNFGLNLIAVDEHFGSDSVFILKQGEKLTDKFKFSGWGLLHSHYTYRMK